LSGLCEEVDVTRSIFPSEGECFGGEAFSKPRPALGRGDHERAQERGVAVVLELDDADDIAATRRDERGAQVVREAVERKTRLPEKSGRRL
jgi:hypothetical protein